MKKSLRLFTLCFLIVSFQNSIAQYQINGSGADLGGGCYQLTPNSGNQHGSVWNVNKINLNFPFDFTFNVFLGCNSNGADGICFGLQPNSASIGSTGNGMGMGGISPSLGVYIDTYQNTSDGDPAYDHISINSNGNVNHNNAATQLAGPVQASSTLTNIKNCAYHTFRVRWDPATLTYSVWFDGVLRLNLVGNDIINTIFGGSPNVYWGFTGSTGGSIDLQKFCILLAANYTNNTICQGVPTSFVDSSLSGTTIATWKWNFGDGTPILMGSIPSTYQNPSHIYTNPGTYTTQLTIYDSGTDSSSISHNVTVVATPVVSVTGGTSICSGQSVNLTGTVTGGTPTITWSPTTNMTNSSTLTPTVMPAVTTTYTLTATNPPGCTTVDSTTVNVSPAAAATFSYVGTPFCQNAANQLPTFTGGGVAGFFTSTPTGLVINLHSGMVAVSASAPGTYIVTDSVPASGACGAAIGTSTITISAIPHATFNYIPTHYCNNGSNPIPTFSGGGTAGTFSSTAGLVFVSTSTGEVDVANSTPGTYTITNTVIGGGCPNSTATSTITITNQSVPTFSYATPYCQSVGTATPTFTGGGVAGIFSSTSLTLFIDPSTGIIDLISSTPGTDTVVNTISAAGGCPTVSDTVSITITSAQAISSFYYANDPYCQNGANPSPTLTGGGSVGVFSSTAGLVFTSTANGTVDLVNSNTGTYTITTTLPASGGCPPATSTASITINPTPVGTFSYASPYCQTTASNPSPTLGTGAVAGVFTCTSPLLVIDSITGVINILASAPGTYTITNTIPASSGCLAVTAITTVTINVPTSATFNYPNSPYCQSGANALPTFTGGGTPGIFTSTAGLVFISTTTGEVDVVNSVPGTYTVTNTLPANACPGGTATATITINVPAVATFSYSGSPYCEASGATPTPVFSGGVAGTFSSTTGLSLNPSTGVINVNSSTPGTYTITNSIAAVGGCPVITATATITINALQTGTFGYPATNYCQIGNTSPINVATLGGIFTSTAGLSINASSGAINLAGSTLGTYTVTYTTPGPCAGTGTATVTISAAPTATAVNTATIDCHTGTVSLNGAGSSSGASVSYLWTTSNGNIVSGATTLTPVVNQAGTYTLTVTNSLTNCTSVATVTVTGVAAPVASFTANPSSGTPPLTVNFTNNSSNATTYTWSFPGGSPLSSSALNATTSYSVTGIYTAYLTVNNSSGCTSRDSMKIDVYDGYSLIVPNVFTPNGDNINDVFKVKSTGVESMEGTIYDRWGLKIYTLNSVDDGWDGHTSSGQTCAEGTYYYIIVTKGEDGSTHQDKGFINLLR